MNRGSARSSGGYKSSRGRSPASGYQPDRRKSENPVSVRRTWGESSASEGRCSGGRVRKSWSSRNSSMYANDGSRSVQAYVPAKSPSIVNEGHLQIGVKLERELQEDKQDLLPSPACLSSNRGSLDEGSIRSRGRNYQRMDDGISSPADISIRLQNVSLSLLDGSSVPSSFGLKDEPSIEEDLSRACNLGSLGHSSDRDKMRPFDIFLEKKGSLFTLKPPLLAQNREKRNAIKQSAEGHNGILLRSGMVLLKNYLSISDQVMIVNTCRQLGLGQGGFYQPGYRDGAILHLKMMCLGKNWDPETCQYSDTRPVDGTKPPEIPIQFNQFVERAVKESQVLVARSSKKANVENGIPSISPDICIVNFYTSTGRLGLHQDKDESEESLRKGLPVVSLSIGDSAEFLYGDLRDVNKAEKVILESGDVLLFGGKARKIFHGVRSILPSSAPKTLLQETNLRPGRLNLTFRQY